MTTTDRPQGNRNYNRRQRSKFFVRKRVCQFCVDKVDSIDYKDIPHDDLRTTDYGTNQIYDMIRKEALKR